MVVKIRLKRFGRRNRAFFRLCASDCRAARDGRTLETLGFYDPLASENGVRVSLKADRIQYWLSVGAQPSETAVSLMKGEGIALPERKKRVRKRPKKGPAVQAGAKSGKKSKKS